MKKLTNRFGKIMAGVALSITIAFTGIAVTAPTTTYAQTAQEQKADNIVQTGMQYLNVRYQFGAKAGRTDAFDCSSFTQYIFRVNGINIPRSSRDQSKVGRYVSKRNLKVGDLVFFYSPIHHVGVYIGNGRILHTYGKPGVTISSIDSGWWARNYSTARRVIG